MITLLALIVSAILVCGAFIFLFHFMGRLDDIKQLLHDVLYELKHPED